MGASDDLARDSLSPANVALAEVVRDHLDCLLFTSGIDVEVAFCDVPLELRGAQSFAILSHYAVRSLRCLHQLWLSLSRPHEDRITLRLRVHESVCCVRGLVRAGHSGRTMV